MKKNNTTKSRKIIFSIIFSYICFQSVCYAVENSDCIECHSDESLQRTVEKNIDSHHVKTKLFIDENKFNKSVHNINEIMCVDCHNDIEELNYDEEIPHKAILQPVTCTNCHAEEGEAFVNSVHMEARGKGIIMKCYACHDYHYVTHQEAFSVAERGNRMCLRCHNPYQSHDWLPQKQAHFDFVECTGCHAPEVSHHIHLNLFDLVENKFLSGKQTLEILKIDYDEFMPLLDRNSDETISNEELDNLVLMLRQKGVHSIFHAELVAELEPAVHQVTINEAAKDCETCHSSTASIFDAVTIVLNKGDGTVDHHTVQRAALESYHIRHFYALAGTRIRLLDKIGIFIIAGGICVVLLHLFVRIMTIPLRRKNKPSTVKSLSKEVKYA